MENKNEKVDVVVIGAGPGGYVAAIRCAQLGLKTACIEKETSLGGTCLNVGCIPSKALLQSSEYYSWLCHDSQLHGIRCKDPTFDFSVMQERKDSIVKGLVNGISSLFKKHNILSLHGTARLTTPNTIEIHSKDGIRMVETQSIILATGSEPIALPFLPFDEKIIVSSTGALALPKVPKKLAVVGGGVIGVELASVYNRLGSEVVIIEMLDRICPTMDEAVSKSLLQLLKKQGINFQLSTKVMSGSAQKGKASLDISNAEGSTNIPCDVVLVSIGRKPYSTKLGLQELNIAMNKGQVQVDANFRTSHPNIYAIGDLIDGPMLAHKASEEGYAVAEIIAGNACHVNYMAIPNVVYTHPEVAAVGMTEKELRDKGLDVKVGIAQFRGNPRARCSGYAEGFVKVIGVGDKAILAGMHLIGPQVSEMINIGVLAIEKKASLHDLAQAPMAHPTLSEAIKEACGHALGSAVHT